MRKSKGLSKPQGEIKVKTCFGTSRWDPAARRWRTTGPFYCHVHGAVQERTWWDPKDGELWLVRLKPGEILVEGRSDSDVQIDRQSWL